jgi:hypothetical protein
MRHLAATALRDIVHLHKVLAALIFPKATFGAGTIQSTLVVLFLQGISVPDSMSLVLQDTHMVGMGSTLANACQMPLRNPFLQSVL